MARRGVLESCVNKVVTAPVPTLERIGGGSVRCMVAELFKRRGMTQESGGRRTDSKKELNCCESEHGRLELVIVHEPGLEVDAVVHVRDLLIEVREEVRRELFESVWGKEFVDGHNLASLQVDQLITGFSREPLQNLFFMRDPVFSVPGGWVVIARPYYPIRHQESRLMRAIFRLHPSLKNVKVYEGLIDDPEDKLAKFLFENTPVQRVVKVFIPKQRAFMHLDTLFTFLDRATVLTMPYFWSKPEIYAEVARRSNQLNEKMGSDQRQNVEDCAKKQTATV
eukprot:g8773.t1